MDVKLARVRYFAVFDLNFTGVGRGKDSDSFNTVQGRFLLK